MILSPKIAFRYLKRPSDALVSAVGLVSVFGLVIGVMALVVSMALMTGYRGDLQKKLLGGNAEVFVYSVGGQITKTPELLTLLRTTPGVAEASPVLFQRALVTSEKNTTGNEVMLKGIEPGRGRTTPMLGRIVGASGRFVAPGGSAGVTVGRYLAAKLGVERGSALTVTVPSETSGSFLPRTETFIVTNVFDTGFYEFDARWLFIDLTAAESLIGSKGSANLVEIKLTPGADLDEVVRLVDQRTSHRYAISDWREMNRQLFSMLKIQQLVLFIVIGLIVFVSTFNIVSTLIMTVHEKRKEIGILASMGAEKWFIMRIFLWYGVLVGCAGTVTGVTLGTILCWVITRFHLVSFPPEIAEVYFVSSIPFVTRVRDLAVIAVFALLVSFLATIIPSLRAARLNPVEALRHE